MKKIQLMLASMLLISPITNAGIIIDNNVIITDDINNGNTIISNGNGVSNVSTDRVQAQSIEANGFCTYSYNIDHGPLIGPISFRSDTCRLSVISNDDGVVITINGDQVN